MKKILFCFVLLAGVCAGGQAKVDFTKPVPLKQFEPVPQKMGGGVSVGGVPANSRSGSRPTAQGRGSAPANVVPINITRIKKNKQNTSLCSAMRLTPTLILTAAHCLAVDGNGGFTNGERISLAAVFQTQNKQWRVDLAPFDKQNVIQPNATVIFYRPNYKTDGTHTSVAFDFALIKLDSSLKLNQAVVHSMLNASDLENLSEELQEQMKNLLMQQINTSFEKEQKNYHAFMKTTLASYSLLQMDPDVVKNFMQQRLLHAYFWGVGDDDSGHSYRTSVETFIGHCVGNDEGHQKSTHTLLFNMKSVKGTSGSPVLDVVSKLVVTVVNGTTDHSYGNQGGFTKGGLISKDVCQWVKSYDSSVKCLAVEGGASYAETDKTAKWGR